uniref:Uncharacterized protein n=1 Tax=Lepeophtheirus salmonis TaxID=72036 RepID=A0A0K2TR21_LEPSM
MKPLNEKLLNHLRRWSIQPSVSIFVLRSVCVDDCVRILNLTIIYSNTNTFYVITWLIHSDLYKYFITLEPMPTTFCKITNSLQGINNKCFFILISLLVP